MNVYTLPIQAAQPSMTLNYNDVVLGLLRVICRIHRLVRRYNRIFHQHITCATCG